MWYRGCGWALLFAMGCDRASIGGSIDGERVGGARDAIWDELTLDLGVLGEWTSTVVMVSDLPESCELLEAMDDAFAFGCEERCDEYLEVFDAFDLRADSYFILTLYANTSESIEGEFTFDDQPEEGEFNGSFATWDTTALRDPDLCEEACKEGELLEANTEVIEDGALDLSSLDKDDELRGRFELDFGGDDSLGGGFAARSCSLAEDWF